MKSARVAGRSISSCIVEDIIGSGAADAVTLSTRKMRYLVVKRREGRLVLSDMNIRSYELQRLTGSIWDKDCSSDLRNVVTSLTTSEGVSAPPAN